MPDSKYAGEELPIFSIAMKWKEYFKLMINPYLGPRVLEVGAGIGATTKILCSGNERNWICLEPDPSLRSNTELMISLGILPECCQSRTGVIQDLDSNERYDTILYIDVLEHIEDDRNELDTAARHLGPEGMLIVLAPAHDFLFSRFDYVIGHRRRYTKKTLSILTPAGCTLHRLMYLDVLGVLPSLVNKFFLRQPQPTERQILFWDRLMIPLSRLLDKVLNYKIGRSIIAVWKRD
jgi:SAM-dependent methyltransferase